LCFLWPISFPTLGTFFAPLRLCAKLLRFPGALDDSSVAPIPCRTGFPGTPGSLCFLVTTRSRIRDSTSGREASLSRSNDRREWQPRPTTTENMTFQSLNALRSSALRMEPFQKRRIPAVPAPLRRRGSCRRAFHSPPREGWLTCRAEAGEGGKPGWVLRHHHR
jgi:hypothetical protein